jgi:hypothetical protein
MDYGKRINIWLDGSIVVYYATDKDDISPGTVITCNGDFGQG